MYRQYTIQNTKLTKREVEVLKCLIDGDNNIKIAQKLSITLHTVKAHVSSILVKLEVADRTQAVIKTLKYKLVKI